MKIKVCGMKYPQNIKDVLNIGIDWMGFIFYPESKRYFKGDLSGIDFKNTYKTGVFVDETIDNIEAIAHRYDLNYIQLHGNETPGFCRELKQKSYRIIKVFKVNDTFDFKQCEAYLPYSDLFLFDTKGKLPGGNGFSFNWSVLQNYTFDKPFLLSGGIDLSLLPSIIDFKHPKCIGVDVNSGFETAPGLKDTRQLKQFVNKIKNEIYN
jgi:phosphoribosylanthranilate isomerase